MKQLILDITCQGCGMHPEELYEYIEPAMALGISPEQYVKEEEGTYNPLNGHFLCTPCYISKGSPTGKNGERWVCP